MKLRRGIHKYQKDHRLRYFTCCILFLFLSACGGGGGSSSTTVSSSDTGAIAFSIAWEASEARQAKADLLQPLDVSALDCQDVGVTTVKATVYDENATLLASGGPWPCDDHSGTIEEVPVGTHRKVVIMGQSGEALLYRGEMSSITVTDGETTDVIEPITAYSFVPGDLSPDDGAQFTAAVSTPASVTLECGASEAAATYHFKIASDSDFTSVLQEIIGPSRTESVSLDAGNYYWKVRYIDQHGNQGDWSETFSFTVTTVTTPTSFADPNLEAAVREELGKTDGELTWEELQTVTYLDATSRDIINIEGIQNLTQLTILLLNMNQISDTTPLQSMTQLTFLAIGKNQLSNIAPLQNLTQLTYLSLWNNQIADITPLQNMTQLTDLYLWSNQISDVTPLQNLTQLTDLELDSNQISDISPLQNLTQLTDLWLADNCITDFSPVSQVANVYGMDTQGDCDGLIATLDCTDLSGSWCGSWSETSCDGESYSGDWVGQLDSDCSFIGSGAWETVSGSIDPSTGILTASGESVVGCGQITLDGQINGNAISGQYTYSVSGSGTFTGGRCD